MIASGWPHVAAIALLLGCVTADAHAGTPGACEDPKRVRLPKPSRDIACDKDMPLLSAPNQSPLAKGRCLTELEETAWKLHRTKGFGFRVIYRPAARNDDGRLLEINPHPRNDIRVCAAASRK